MQLKNTQDSHELDMQIAALRRLHQQAQEATVSLPYRPSITSIRINNIRDSRSGIMKGARASGAVRMTFYAEIIVAEDDGKI